MLYEVFKLFQCEDKNSLPLLETCSLSLCSLKHMARQESRFYVPQRVPQTQSQPLPLQDAPSAEQLALPASRPSFRNAVQKVHGSERGCTGDALGWDAVGTKTKTLWDALSIEYYENSFGSLRGLNTLLARRLSSLWRKP